MTINSILPDCKIPMIGEAAHNWLSQGQHGRILTSVSQATYLLTETGELIWVTSVQGPKHRRGLQSSTRLPRIPADSAFEILDQAIVFDPGIKLNFFRSHIWKEPAIPSLEVIAIDKVPGKVISIFNKIDEWDKPVGIGSFIQPILEIANNHSNTRWTPPDDIATRKTWTIINKIIKACFLHDLSEVMVQARSLIGLGEGLTPSGDDFVGGLLFARHLLLCLYPELLYLQLNHLNVWVESIKPRTNLISFVLLKDNANGHALDPLNRFGMELLTDRSQEKTCTATSELVKVGHSTGWSMLTGFLVGMLMTFPIKDTAIVLELDPNNPERNGNGY